MIYLCLLLILLLLFYPSLIALIPQCFSPSSTTLPPPGVSPPSSTTLPPPSSVLGSPTTGSYNPSPPAASSSSSYPTYPTPPFSYGTPPYTPPVGSNPGSPASYQPSPGLLSPPYNYEPSPPTISFPSPTGFIPTPPLFEPPVVYPPPSGPAPPHSQTASSLQWCVAKPSVPDPIIQEALNYACGSGADCEALQPNGVCFQPDTLFAHASYAFNSYWQRTKVAGATCEFGGSAMLVTVDPSSNPGSPASYQPSPGLLSPPYNYEPSPPTISFPSPTGFIPTPPLFEPPVVYPPPSGPAPPHSQTASSLQWCVAKPSVPDPIIQEALNYACGSGADCEALQPNGVCFQPDTLFAHASYAFNSYWQRTKVAGATCEFGGSAMLVTIDPSIVLRPIISTTCSTTYEEN
ncbi:hypothetical protein SSX86_011013 [Deinandra increscens subsp. villosa]|uniref:X8 domain-containing protein n=1 Tax=Deinandra increscens subsp. villosa TaxID=3103831 RepID=A0AAP0DA05_9ASTR